MKNKNLIKRHLYKNNCIPMFLSNLRTSTPKKDFFWGTGSGTLSSPKTALQVLLAKSIEMLKNCEPAKINNKMTTVLINLNLTLRFFLKHHIFVCVCTQEYTKICVWIENKADACKCCYCETKNFLKRLFLEISSHHPSIPSSHHHPAISSKILKRDAKNGKLFMLSLTSI